MATKIIHGKMQRLRVYAWEFPVRLTHWFNAFSILFLSITGYYIGDPFMHAYSSKQWIMGWMRLIHFIVAYVFLMSVIIRMYWAFMGNQFASWRECFPVSTEKRKEFMDALKFYFFIRKEPPYVIGHAALASFTYFLVFVVFIFEIVSGFALYSVSHPPSIVWTLLGGWLLNIMHLPTIRLYHHFVMYVILAFVPLHIYATWYMDPHEKNGLVSSMFSGFKFVPEKEIEEAEQ
ncbi:MAG: Ni/Fe-hydrogenase, b-type cytochrome subunit [Nitrospirae bacterium]|nr:Ni/Fe-hydrogenase, b-type cytochrome subunit [Nitrospirota bacterium]